MIYLNKIVSFYKCKFILIIGKHIFCIWKLQNTILK